MVVTDVDVRLHDELDELIQLLNPTPDRNSSVATWTTITVHGRRPTSPTRYAERTGANLCFFLLSLSMNPHRRQYVVRYAVRPLTPMSRDRYHRNQWSDLNETCREYSSCELALLKRFSRSEVKGVAHDHTECYNDRGMRFDDVETRLFV